MSFPVHIIVTVIKDVWFKQKKQGNKKAPHKSEGLNVIKSEVCY
tara:strand:+ start:443 stop:574 length:132 start_codon:yes stop_codon:yes gene_type:complete